MNQLNTKVIEDILSRSDVEFAAIFGSRARGEAKDDSDLDMLIRFKTEDKTLLDLVHLQNQLSQAMGVDVDLVTEPALHPLMRDQVYSDLQVIYEKR